MGGLLRGALAGLTACGIVLAAGDAGAFSVKRTVDGELVHWEGGHVSYTLDPSVDANVRGAGDATRTAMQSWSGDVGAPDLSLVAPAADAPTKPGFDQKNGVFFVKGGYAPAGRALAITVLTYDNASGRILDADIIFNGAYTFAVLDPRVDTDRERSTSGAHPSTTDGLSHDNEETPTGTTYDLHHVVAHELGHSLGMNDEMERRDALMYRYTTPNDASMRQPASDDISGLAELYSTKLEAHGNGCGGATVAPKKPGAAASRGAMLAALGLLLFLALRARSDRRARVGFVAVAAAAGVLFLPSPSGGGRSARAATSAPGQARARVLSTTTSLEDGLFKTTYALATVACRASSCPREAKGAAWGGTIGGVRQEVGGWYAPKSGDDVDVSFTKLPDALAPLTNPLGGRADEGAGEVRVLTPAD